ncbi:MAG: FAD-binding protein [Terracidiphilus sp.]
MKIIETDVLVVGGGGAADRAAIEAHDAGAKVLLITKGRLGMTGATAYDNGASAGLCIADGGYDPTDSPDIHLQDIVTAGMGMCDEKLSHVLTQEVLRIAPDLERWGVWFEHDEEGRYLRTKACFSSKIRNYRLAEHGRKIVNALKAQIRKRDIQFMEYSMLVDVIVKDNQVIGAVVLQQDGTPLLVHCAAVVLGTGGLGQLFQYNMNPPDLTGDGYAIGFRAGAKLVNMEFQQLGLTILPGRYFIGYWLWAFCPVLRNGEGKEFLAAYLPEGVTEEQVLQLHATHYPFTSRLLSKYLDMAIHDEVVAGRTSPNGGVFVDFKGKLERQDIPDATRKLWKLSQESFARRNIDISKDPLEVINSAMAMNGGLRIDEHAETTVKGLFAAGETAGGPHGADRLGGGMITASQAFGRLAGIAAAKVKRQAAVSPLKQAGEQVEQMLDRMRVSGNSGRCKVYDLHKELQQLSTLHLMLNRNEAGLLSYQKALARLEELLCGNTEIASAHDLHKVMEMRNLLQTGLVMAQASLMRKETRGGHVRSDFPQTDPKTQWITISKAADGSPNPQWEQVGS